MGKTKWFHSRIFHLASHGFWFAMEAFVGFIVQHIGNKKKAKGGGSPKKHPVKRKT